MLTDLEKHAGRRWRERSQAALEKSHEDDPPTFVPPPWLRHYRHNCELRGGRSTSMELKEKYVLSPELWVCYCSAVGELEKDYSPDAHGCGFPHDDCDGGKVAAVKGRFAFIFKEGRCGCGATARSRAGRLVDAYERPPLSGRVGRA